MPRVLHINDYPPESLGGTEVLMARTVALLQAADWEARIFSVANLPDRRLTALRYLHNRVACRSLKKLLAEFQPNVVHLHNYYHHLSPGILDVLGTYKTATNARVVMTAHDYHLACPNSGGNWWRHGLNPVEPVRLQSWSYLASRRWDHRGLGYSLLKLAQHVLHYRLTKRWRSIDLLICPSLFIQSVISPIGIPTAFLAHPNPHTPKSTSSRPPELTMTFAGRIEPEKGLVAFLRLMPANFPGSLQIIGEGSDRATAESIVRDRGLTERVRFLGRLPHLATHTKIAESHVLLLPSLFLENYPLSLLEALCAGTNILVCDLGGMREIARDSGVGFVFAPGDSSGLARRLEEISAAHRDGTLNSFDISSFLATRTEDQYLAAIQRIYAGGLP